MSAPTFIERQVFITRYALTRGIIERRMLVELRDGHRCAKPLESRNLAERYYDDDVWLDRPGAVKRVMEMIRAKRLSMTKIALRLTELEASLDPTIADRLAARA